MHQCVFVCVCARMHMDECLYSYADINLGLIKGIIITLEELILTQG